MGTGGQLEGTATAGKTSNCTVARIWPRPSVASNNLFCPPLSLPESLAPARQLPAALWCHERFLEGLRSLATGTRAEGPQRSPAPFPEPDSRPAPPPRSHGPAPAPWSPGEVAPAAASGSFQHRGADSSRAGAAGRRRGEPPAGGSGRVAYRSCRGAGGARRPAALLGGGAAGSEDRRRRREPRFWCLRAEAAARRCRSAGATSRPKILTWTPSSASSRARVSVCVGVGGRSGVLFPRQGQSDPSANFEWSRVGDAGC